LIGGEYVADPKNGAVTDMPAPPLRTPDQLISPDGRLQLSLRLPEAVDAIDRESGKVRTLVLRKKDRKYVGPSSFEWRDSRYVECGPFFIDVASMRIGRMTLSPEGYGFSFSPEFKWATAWSKDGEITVGRVVSPPAPGGKQR